MKRLSREAYAKIARRPEQALEYDLHGLLLNGWEPGFVYKDPKVRHSAQRRPYDGSINHRLRAIAVASAAGEDVRDECAEVLALFDSRGHMLAEWCSVNYSYHQVEPLVTIAAFANDPSHPVAAILRRQSLLWSVLARPIVCRNRGGKVEYRGYGWRQAGLRGTPNNWGGWLDSMFMSEVLGLDGGPSAIGARRNSEAYNAARKLDPLAGDGFYRQTFRRLALWQRLAAVERTALFDVAAEIRIADGMGAILARDIKTGDTFSCMTGARKGGNTGATWAVHCTGPELRTHRATATSLRLSGDCQIAFPWRLANREHVLARVRRNYRGKPNYFQKPGPVAGFLPLPDRMQYRCSTARGEVFDLLQAPGWLWDDSRAIRLEVTDQGATLNLPGGA